MKLIQHFGLGLTLGLLPALHAGAYIIDFEDVPASTSFDIEIVTQDFQFKSGFSGWVVGAPTTGIVTNPLPTRSYVGSGDGEGLFGKVDLPGPGLRMSRVDGGIFDLAGFFAANFYMGVPELLTVIGNLDTGGTISQTFSLSDTGQSFALNFAGLESADFYTADLTGGFQIDNITDTPSTVPAPAGGILLLTALALMTGLRRTYGWRITQSHDQ